MKGMVRESQGVFRVFSPSPLRVSPLLDPSNVRLLSKIVIKPVLVVISRGVLFFRAENMP